MSGDSRFLRTLALERSLETCEVPHIDVEIAVRIRRHQEGASAYYEKLIGQGTSKRTGTGRERVLETGEIFKVDVPIVVVVEHCQTE